MLAPSRVNLLERFPLLKAILKSRAFQPVLMLATLSVFMLAILTGLFGTPAGSRNFGIIFVWIVWWALLIIVMVPLSGRLWCAICPIPAPGEWLQRRSIVQRRSGRLLTLNRRWPRRLKNMWLQNFGFLGVAVFSTIILTRPAVSAWVLFSFLMVGVLLSALYRQPRLLPLRVPGRRIYRAVFACCRPSNCAWRIRTCARRIPPRTVSPATSTAMAAPGWSSPAI